MKNYSMRQIERLSGVKAHTIRIWEQRHGIVKPLRNNNVRLFVLSDLKKLARIAFLLKNGYKLKTIAGLSDEELSSRVSACLVSLEDRMDYIVNDLVFAMEEKDPLAFEMLLDQAAMNWPVDLLMEKVIFPFLYRTGLFWNGSLLTEEHFVVTAMRKKMMHAIEVCSSLRQGERTILLFLLPGSELDLGLIFANYAFKKKGWKVMNVGTGISSDNLSEYWKMMAPEVAFTYSSFKDQGQADLICLGLKKSLPLCMLYMASYPDGDHLDYGYANVTRLKFEDAFGQNL